MKASSVRAAAAAKGPSAEKSGKKDGRIRAESRDPVAPLMDLAGSMDLGKGRKVSG